MAVPLIGSREATGESLEINERYVRGSRGNIGTTGRRLFHICPIMVLPNFPKCTFAKPHPLLVLTHYRVYSKFFS